jgi:hypothetical protein
MDPIEKARLVFGEARRPVGGQWGSAAGQASSAAMHLAVLARGANNDKIEAQAFLRGVQTPIPTFPSLS